MITIAGIAYPEMADSITPANLNNLPFTPDAYLGYVDGRWADYAQIAAAHPGRPCYGLTVTGNQTSGDGTDTEPGNIDIAGAVNDTRAELARGVDRPIVYCPASWASQAVQAHTATGIARNQYRLLTAHYGGPTAPGAPLAGMHICGPGTCGYGPGSDGTQWQSLDAYDRSLLAPDFITAAPHPGPTPTPAADPLSGENMILRDPTSGGVWVVADRTGAIYNYDGAPFLGGTNGTKINPQGYPCVGICEFHDSHGVGYELVLDWGDRGDGHSADGGDRFRRYRFPRDASMAHI